MTAYSPDPDDRKMPRAVRGVLLALTWITALVFWSPSLIRILFRIFHLELP